MHDLLLTLSPVVTDVLHVVGTLQDTVTGAAGAAGAAGDAAASAAEPGVIRQAVDFVLHINVHLEEIIKNYGAWIYVLLFLIVFCETGLVVTPFLPGDSLLFAAGALSGDNRLNIWLVMGILIVAAILGDTVNYWVGSRFRGVFAEGRRVKLVKPAHLERTRLFFEKYGGKAIIIARFVPIVRTVTPFFAGLGTMNYGKFMLYNVAGAFLWVLVCAGAGYFFGNMPWVKKNFELVVLGIIVVSLIPLVVEFVAAREAAKRKTK